MTTVVEQRFDCGVRLDFSAILRPMQRGRHDPTMALSGSEVWRTAATPTGSVTQRLIADSATVISRCWGPGAGWMNDRTVDLIGLHDDLSTFSAMLPDAVTQGGVHRLSGADAEDYSPGLSLIAREWRRRRSSWRVPKGHNVWESVVAAVLEQKVTGLEAKRAWQRLAKTHGELAPGPAPTGMRVFPTPTVLRNVPSWEWRRMGVDRPRSDTLMRLARIPHVLDRLPSESHIEARRLLTAVPGVGDWTYAEVAQRALGDPDALSVGDFHLAGMIVYAFTGAFDGTDDQMLGLLAPFAGQRYRAVRMIELAGIAPPRRGPRMPIPPTATGE